jgi:hypothetical protein
MKLFDNKKRTNNKLAKFIDNDYDFYDRSCLYSSKQIRDMLNLWFEHYPENGKVELKARFQDKFSAAYFELFLHELFFKQGFTLELHPTINGTNKRPDFLVKGKDIKFYLEAKEVNNKSDSERSNDNRVNQLYDSISQINSPNFLLKIDEIILKSSNQPSAKKIKKYIEEEIKNFDPDVIHEKIIRSEFDYIKPIIYEDETIKLVISLIPKAKEFRGKKGVSSIGMFPWRIYLSNSDEAIKKAIGKKAIRYGKLDKPYMICINVISRIGVHNKNKVFEILFGKSKNNSFTYTDTIDKLSHRSSTGIFSILCSPRFTRVSAVFITEVYPTNLHVADYWLVKNPFAKIDLPFDLFQLKKYEVNDNEIITLKGKSIKEILKIPDDWMTTDIFSSEYYD